MRASHLFAIACILCLMMLPESLWAQATAQISGTVGDQSGAVLPGVKITATQVDTGASRSTTTNTAGMYVLPNLPLGPYRLEAAVTGFRTFLQTGIVLQVGSNPVLNIQMNVGQIEQTVEVKAEATSIDMRSLGVGTVVDTQSVVDLPLNGRDVTALITLSGLSVQTGRAPGYTMDTGVNIRQSANVTFVASTPSFSGNSWLKRVASDWNFSTIVQVRSGQPLMPMIGSDRAYNGMGFGQAALTGTWEWGA